MSEIKITHDSIENGVFRDGQLAIMGFTENYISNASVTASGVGNIAVGGLSQDNDYIYINGTGSFAHGRNVSVNGNYSNAEGENLEINASCAHAEGYNTKAFGIYSHAEGYNTSTNNTCAHAEGYFTTASGMYSHAEGNYTHASQFAAHAEGCDSTASGEYSHVEGINTTASGYASHAEGSNTKALEFASHAEGTETTASGTASHAEGSYTTASGSISHAEGERTIASGYTSHAEGFNTIVSGQASHAEGWNTSINGDYSHAEGYNTKVQGFKIIDTMLNGDSSYGSSTDTITVNSDPSSIFSVNDIAIINNKEFVISVVHNGPYYLVFSTNISIDDITWSQNNHILKKEFINAKGAHAEGSYTEAAGDYSHAEGEETHTNGKASHAEGHSTIANGDYSHAEGEGSTASGLNSHAEGYFTTALEATAHAEGSGTQALAEESHAEGNNTKALGYASHAEGEYTIASCDYSHAGGIGTIANQEAMTAIGKYNVSTNTENTLFVVGDGTDDTETERSDAFRVVSCGSSTESSIPSSVQAKVNNVSDVYLGCPIGTVVMWAGETAPKGWLLCTGDTIAVTQVSQGEEDFSWEIVVAETPQIKYLKTKDRQYAELGKVIKGFYGVTRRGTNVTHVYLPNFKGLFPVGIGEGTDANGTTYEFTFGSYTPQSGHGEYSHTLTDDEMPKHHHKLSTNNAPLYDDNTDYRVPDYDTTNKKLLYNNDGANPYVVDVVNGYNYDGRGIDDALRITDSTVDRTIEPGIQIPAAVEENDYYYVHSTGGDAAHNNIPPFLAINFIIKYK